MSAEKQPKEQPVEPKKPTLEEVMQGIHLGPALPPDKNERTKP